MENTFIIGGCRSGKSSHALKRAEEITGRRVFIATCVPHDDEMKERVLNHQEERKSRQWETVEAPLLLPEAIVANSKNSDVILADCLTLWVSNLFMEEKDTDRAAQDLIQAMNSASCPVILVSNEVGTGIVPENPLARRFRDATGFLNQQVAAASDRVIWMVAGIPVPVKGAK
ncbi:MAG: bifunctional adenosylcobinamide kinase/adenosylcobinamide-phosphate guanylyltransferase [Desulfobacterales bacterium]|nr:bifunctional adenosylcobinamide kinase/adenosylcobinamide-phosphate guanylyltransferase [Desulfobacterales bacterium]